MKNGLKNGKTIKIRIRGIDGAAAQSVMVLLLVLTLFLCMLPVLITIVMSLKLPEDITGYPIWTFPRSGWAFSNYSRAFGVLSSPLLWTLLMDIGVSVTVMVGSCYVAFLFQWYRFKGNKLLFALFILPMLLSVACPLYSATMIGPFVALPIRNALDKRREAKKNKGAYVGKKKAEAED